MFRIPIVIIIFNRPEITRRVFEKIKIIKPLGIYIIADGPRELYPSDIEKCKQAREIFEKINWDCEVHRYYSEYNLGCGRNIAQGLNWVFENEEMAIILEDDTLPAIPFFQYCQELLIRYKDDNRIMHIGGTNWHPDFKVTDASYFFSKKAHIWGWATWKRAWNFYDYYMEDYPKFVSSKQYKNVINLKREQKYFLKRWGSFYKANYLNKERSNWDYQWYYTILKNNGLCTWPSSNLISNICPIGTHANIKSHQSLFFRKVNENYRIEKHPDFIISDVNFDNYHFFKHNYQSIVSRLINRTNKFIKALWKIT